VLTSIPGPVDRTHFFDAQRRHRRASWRWSVVAGVAAVLSGLPLSILLSPLLFGLTLLLLHLVDLAAPVPADLWRACEQIARATPNAWATLRGDVRPVPWNWLVAVLVVPGSLTMLAAWLWIRALFRHVGVGGILRRLRTRRPNQEVLEEVQVRNIVEEIAIAAGVPPPRVALIDSDAANAAAVGLTIDDATVLVSRGLLEIDRDARQAILAHVIASVANGDLKIASSILTVFQSWGLLALALDAPFGPRARTALRQFFTVSRRALRNPAERDRAERTLDGLLDGAGMTFDDLDEHMARAEGPRPISLALFVDVPLYLTMGIGAIAAKAAIALFTLLVFGPWVARLWRARRRLADATAVQLTRYPDALARAVREMEGRNVAVEGGAAVSFLFPFWTRWTPDTPARDDVTAHVVGTQLDPDQRLKFLRQLGASPNEGAAGVSVRASTRTTLREIARFVGWSALALVLVVACVAFNLLTMSFLLWGVWTVLWTVFRGVV
jgi:Zn-dependent protease with chaperone function